MRQLPPWRQAEPYRRDPGWLIALELVTDVLVLITLFFGLPLLLWLVAS